MPVHPRGHGEHPIFIKRQRVTIGSSPWARGTLNLLRFAKLFKTVHPRVHGEHLSGTRNLISLIGSSPWARGTLEQERLDDLANRFIPVGTGNTSY